MSNAENIQLNQENMTVELNKLAELTGFPVEYIVKELMLDNIESISMNDLRTKMLNYLEKNFS